MLNAAAARFTAEAAFHFLEGIDLRRLL